MSEQFQEQGGAATMDPSPLRRWLFSAFIKRMLRPERLLKKRQSHEKQRSKKNARHRVEFFYQLDDAYSHLAAQLLSSLVERYDIELVCYLVSGAKGDNLAEPELLSKLSSYDACSIASHYGLTFPQQHQQSTQPIDPYLLELGSAILSAQSSDLFIHCAAQVGQALWSGDKAAMAALASQHGCADAIDATAHLKAGNARRDKLGHYSGAMFYYAGEWYWGVDRLYHLESRLRELGVDQCPQKPPLAPRPEISIGHTKDNGRLRLEVYVSLRSPYTAISFDRSVRLAQQTGVELVVRPVLPMVMRGVPVTREKGLYIFFDAAREAAIAAVPFGQFYDPVGEPVRRCYSLYPWACEQGKGAELLSSFLHCAFAQGVNTNTDLGLRAVVERAGLDWSQALGIIGKSGWEEMLDANRKAMYDAGLWGVPSFRLIDENGQQILALWGQDRLWLVAREIQSILTKRNREKL
jgi:2-hydroxychromene-2-carboxylate isomerase